MDYFFPAGAQRGTTVEVAVGGTFERWPVQAWIDRAGVAVTPAKTNGKLTITVAADAEPGTYWIRLFDAQGASVAKPFIVGILPEVAEKEPNDDFTKPQVLGQSKVTINGRLGAPGDVDAFALKLTKGQTLVASLEAYRILRSPMDGVLQILSADGFVLEQNDDYHLFDPQIAFAVPRDGVYLVRVFAFPAVPTGTIRFAGKDTFIYRLTLTTGAFVDYAYPLAVAQSSPGSVELIGWNLPEALRSFPVTPSAKAGMLKLFHPQIANPFFVRVVPHPTAVKKIATIEQPQAITLPITISSRVDRGSKDVYAFHAKKGQKLGFQIESRTLGFPLDPVLRLTDDTGKIVSEAKAAALGTDSRLEFKGSKEGAYRIEVRDLHGDGGPRFVYRLSAGPVEPDFTLKATTDRFVLTPGMSLDIPVTVERKGSFNGSISLRVEGLPTDAAVAQTSKEAAATSKVISLRITAGKNPFSGPIRIQGQAREIERSVYAPIAELGRTTEDLWLSWRP